MKEEGYSKGVTDVEGLKLRKSDASVVSNQQPSSSNPSMNEESIAGSIGREVFSIALKSMKLLHLKKAKHPFQQVSKSGD